MFSLNKFCDRQREKNAKFTTEHIRQISVMQYTKWVSISIKEKLWVLGRLIETLYFFSQRNPHTFWHTLFVSLNPIFEEGKPEKIYGFKLTNAVEAFATSKITDCDRENKKTVLLSMERSLPDFEYNHTKVTYVTALGITDLIADYTDLFPKQDITMFDVVFDYINLVSRFYRLTKYHHTVVDGVVSPMTMEFASLAKDHQAPVITIIFDYNSVVQINKDVRRYFK